MKDKTKLNIAKWTSGGVMVLFGFIFLYELNTVGVGADTGLSFIVFVVYAIATAAFAKVEDRGADGDEDQGHAADDEEG